MDALPASAAVPGGAGRADSAGGPNGAGRADSAGRADGAGWPGGSAGAAVGAIAAALAATNLRPGPVVNGLFQALVAVACAVPDDHPDRVGSGALATLHRLCSRGETYLEAHWARRVAADPGTVEDFPYLDNYRRMVQAEHAAITSALGRPPRTLAFAGSGPLPLTAVLFCQSAPGLRVTCLDNDEPALRWGRRVARALVGAGNGDGPLFVRADAVSHDYAGYDVVIVAALVGLTPAEKSAVLDRAAGTLSPESLLAARSVPADGRRLLYPRIDPDTVPASLTVLGESTPPPGVINNLLLLSTAHGSCPRRARHAVPAATARHDQAPGGG